MYIYVYKSLIEINGRDLDPLDYSPLKTSFWEHFKCWPALRTLPALLVCLSSAWLSFQQYRKSHSPANSCSFYRTGSICLHAISNFLGKGYIYVLRKKSIVISYFVHRSVFLPLLKLYSIWWPKKEWIYFLLDIICLGNDNYKCLPSTHYMTRIIIVPEYTVEIKTNTTWFHGYRI